MASDSSLVGGGFGERGGGTVGEGDEEEMRNIHEANMKRIYELSPEERRAAVEDLHQVLDPTMVRLLRQRV